MFSSPSRTGATADPRINGDLLADDSFLGAFPCRFNYAGDFVTECKRQSAIFGDIETLVAAKREIAVLDVQVRVAHAAAGHTHQNFAAARYRTIGNGFAQRLPISNQRLAAKFAHAVLSPAGPCISIGW
jgi:hypothetical protein